MSTFHDDIKQFILILAVAESMNPVSVPCQRVCKSFYVHDIIVSKKLRYSLLAEI